jgi:hypothetical protein
METIKLIQSYIKREYGEDFTITDCEDRNNLFDINAHKHNMHIRIEYKRRDFITGENERYLDENDILIELVQKVPYFTNNKTPTNGNVNNLYNPDKINKSIGWFYKCNADRLFYIKFFNGNYHEFIDMDFILFKGWFLNNIDNFELQYSNKTTGTINSKVPYSKIPKPIIRIFDKNGKMV